MSNQEPVLLGINHGKEYYLHPSDKKHLEPYLCWRVPDIREGIRARPGWKILGADYSQIEVRLMAWESHDEWLLAALNSGKDIHCYMAADVHGVPYEDFYYAYKHKDHSLYHKYYGWRSEIKTTTFGVPYGAGAKQVAKQINSSRKSGDTSPLFTEEQAQQLIDDYFKKAKGLKKWLDKQGKHALTKGESKSLGGHYRFYQLPKEGNDDYEERTAQIERWSGNHPIQAGCADMLKMAVGKIYLDLRGGISSGPLVHEGHFILFVHDELVLTAPDNEAPPVKKIMIDGMQWAYEQLIGTKNIIHETDVTVNDYWEKG
jgi:DNA polymerase-1